jgi:hypothetical protein
MPSHSRTAEEQIETTISEEIERISDAIAAQLGPAPGTRRISDAEAAKAWWRRDPMVDYDALVNVLQTSGMDPAMLDPENQQGLAIAKLTPEVAELYLTPQPPEMAVALATLAEYPHRLGIMSEYEDDPEGMVELAEKLGRSAPPAPKPMPQMADDLMSMVGG